MHLALIALAIGIIAGLRAMMPLAAVAWAARTGHLPLSGTHLAWLGNAWVPWIFTSLAIIELYNDKLPKTPSRLIPPQFITRVVTGSLAGAAIGYGLGCPWQGTNCGSMGILVGALCGAIGAILGTLGGARARGALAKAFGKDLPAALIEDLVAIVGSYLIITHI